MSKLMLLSALCLWCFKNPPVKKTGSLLRKIPRPVERHIQTGYYNRLNMLTEALSKAEVIKIAMGEQTSLKRGRTFFAENYHKSHGTFAQWFRETNNLGEKKYVTPSLLDDISQKNRKEQRAFDQQEYLDNLYAIKNLQKKRMSLKRIKEIQEYKRENKKIIFTYLSCELYLKI